MKNILVCVKLVPVDNHVQMNADFHLERGRMLHQLNIADMAAVEAALSCKEETYVTVLTMGTKAAVPVLQDLLSRGADRAVLLTDRCMAGSDTGATAAVIEAAVKYLGGFDLILCGRKAIDGETGQVPGEIAAKLGFPCITNVSQIEIQSDTLTCTRLLEDGCASLCAGFPCVVSVCEYSYTLRLPSIRGRRAAASKSVEILSAQELSLHADQCGQKGSKTKVIKTAGFEAGLRKGPRETNLEEGAKQILSIIREKSQ